MVSVCLHLIPLFLGYTEAEGHGRTCSGEKLCVSQQPERVWYDIYSSKAWPPVTYFLY